MSVTDQMPPAARELVARLDLQPHPEGGFFRETYRASLTLPGDALAPAFSGARQASTAIYFLLGAGDRSRFHRIRADEVWHFYCGDPLQVVELTETGTVQVTLLGSDFAAGQVPQHVVPAGRWFGACPAPGAAYSLVGCTVAPGFDFADFEMADGSTLMAAHPAAADWIKRLS
jgi:predicted cupin superfamily sugar epimerase